MDEMFGLAFGQGGGELSRPKHRWQPERGMPRYCHCQFKATESSGLPTLGGPRWRVGSSGAKVGASASLGRACWAVCWVWRCTARGHRQMGRGPFSLLCRTKVKQEIKGWLQRGLGRCYYFHGPHAHESAASRPGRFGRGLNWPIQRYKENSTLIFSRSSFRPF